MPGVIPTLGNDGLLPAIWSGMAQQINKTAGVAAGAASNPSRQSLDQFQNTTMVQGALSQTVTVGGGGSYQGGVYVGQMGVQVPTNLTGFGIAYVATSSFASTTVTTVKGSATAHVVSATGFVDGYVIGAIDADGNSVLGVANGPPGCTYTVSGTTITLSEPALETGSGFYCASCLWTQASGNAHS